MFAIMLLDVRRAFCLLVWEFLCLLFFFSLLDLLTFFYHFDMCVLAAEVALIGAYPPAQCCNGRAGMLRDVLRVFCLLVWEFLLFV